MSLPITILDASDVATHLGIARRTVTDKAARGEFPGAFQIGSLWRFPTTAVEAYIAAHEPKVHVAGSIEPRRARRKAS